MDSRLPLMRTLAPDLRIAPPRLSLGVLAGVLLVHAGILAGVLTLTHPTQSITLPAPLYVRLIEASTAQPEPAPPPVQPSVQPPPPPGATKPVLSAPPAPAKPAAEAVQPARQPLPAEPARLEPARPETLPAPTPAPAATEAPPLPVTQPRFNADYLDNPKPPYPAASRRMGEEGEVRLRVHVDTTGQAQQIEVYRSSGFPRLDQAALDTVKQWRFVPARQGDQPIPAWVIVPIQFSLRS